MEQNPYIQIGREGAVGKIILNRPEKYNCMIRSMALSIQKAMDLFAEEEGIRAILMTGKGKAFCAGQDLTEATGKNPIEISKIIGEHFNPIIRKMRHIEKPVVVAVNGIAAGAGASIALAGDLTIAGESAQFLQAFVHIGLIPDSGSTFFLPRLVGMQRARALMMLGDRISAEQAEQWGMIYNKVADHELENKAMELAAQLASMPTTAIGLMKRALNRGWTNSLDEQLELEDNLQVIATRTQDFSEGVAAFLEKRKPYFQGK